MASPLKSTKQTVNLGSGGVRVSRIRRDPPPPKLKEITIEERNERDQRNAIIGIAAFTMAVLIILWGIASYTGHSPREYILQL